MTMAFDALTPDSTLRQLRDALGFASQSDTHDYMAGLYQGEIEADLRRIAVHARELQLLGRDQQVDFDFVDKRLVEYLSVKMGLDLPKVLDLAIRQVSSALGLNVDSQLGQPNRLSPVDTGKASVNARMFDELSRNPGAEEWTLRKWKSVLGCAISTVQKTKCWKSIIAQREARKEATKGRAKRRYND